MGQNIATNAQVGSTWALKQGKTKAYIAVADYAPGVTVLEAFKKHYIAHGGEIVGEDRMPLNTVDFAPYAERIANANPDFVTFGGDITYNGNDPEDWKVYDRETAIWHDKHIRVYPALGNHDLHGDLNVSLANYFQRYPELDHSLYYSVNCGNVMILLSGGTVLSFLAIPEIIKPKPINTISPSAAKMSMLTMVITPCTSVKPKK